MSEQSELVEKYTYYGYDLLCSAENELDQLSDQEQEKLSKYRIAIENAKKVFDEFDFDGKEKTLFNENTAESIRGILIDTTGSSS